MATVTGFTADRMKVIEDTTVVSGLVDVNGDLILYQRDNTEINAGNVIGPPASLPDRLSSTGMLVSDWNQVMEPGFYYGVGAANYPASLDNAGGSNFTGIVRRYSNTGAVRIIQELREARGTGYGTLYTRYHDGTNWLPWVASYPNVSSALGNVSLDTIVEAGVYYQATNVNGTAANNYPLPRAISGADGTTGTSGMLEVFTWRQDQIYQRFTRRGDGNPQQVWTRAKYTTGAWTAWMEVSSTPAGWVSLQPYLASGISYTVAAGLQARRVGMFVELMYSYLVVDSISVPIDGNVANRTLLNAIPAQFRPEAPQVGMSNVGNGAMHSAYISSAGTLILSALSALVNATGTATQTSVDISGYAFYPAAL